MNKTQTHATQVIHPPFTQQVGFFLGGGADGLAHILGIKSRQNDSGAILQVHERESCKVSRQQHFFVPCYWGPPVYNEVVNSDE